MKRRSESKQEMGSGRQSIELLNTNKDATNGTLHDDPRVKVA